MTTNREITKILDGLMIQYEYDADDNAFLFKVEMHGQAFYVAIRADVKGNNIYFCSVDFDHVTTNRVAFLEMLASFNFTNKLLKAGLAPDGEVVRA